jgi:metal-dependent amidase/aminoacylase/carboxypeptidase family protein
MVQQGVLQNPKPEAVFGLHVTSGLPAGQLAYRGGPARASADGLRIKVIGRQGHAGFPWRAVDPITIASQIVLGLQTIVSRRTDLMKSPAVVSITTINGGSVGNIIPDSVEMTGTIRTYDQGVRKGIHRDINADRRKYRYQRRRPGRGRYPRNLRPDPKRRARHSAHGAGARACSRRRCDPQRAFRRG